MYDILHGPDLWQRALPVPPTQRWSVEQLRYVLDKVIQYRRGITRKVGGSYLLVRLLESLDVDLTGSDQAYVWRVEDVAFRVTNTLHLTSMWGHGRPFTPGIFYGKGVNEVIIASTDAFDLEEGRQRWQELMPIRVMSHPLNDFTLPYLDGTGEGVKAEGWAVIVVNVAMLAFQYKCWWETFVKGQPDSVPGISLFLGQYPLANLLYSHLDITLLNRTIALDTGAPLREERDPNPFYTGFQAAGQTDRTIAYALRFMQRPNLTFDDWLDMVPQACTPNVHHWLAFPELAFVTQVEWAMFMARLPVMGWLLRHNAQEASQYNRSYVIAIRHWVQRMTYGRFYHQGLHGVLLEEIKATVAQTLLPYL